MLYRTQSLLLTLWVLLLLNGSALAQGNPLAEVDRFELGQRLRAFEATLETQTNVDIRRQAIIPLKPVTGLFFTGQFAEIARLLDTARLTLLTKKEPQKQQLLVQSLSVRPDKVLLDAANDRLAFSVRACYAIAGEKVATGKVRVQLLSSAGKVMAGPALVDLARPDWNSHLSIASVAPGDYLFQAEVLNAQDQPEVQWQQSIAIIKDLNNRLERLHKEVDRPELSQTIDGASASRLTTILDSLIQGQRLETSYPASRLLTEAEDVLKQVNQKKSYYGQRRIGQFWLRIPLEKRSIDLRLQAPEQARTGQPLPLLIALHGAGGSDNMFFEGYGNGLITRLCAERGWMLVAPSNTIPTPELLTAIDKLYPIDRQKVFLVGHSMGAAMAVQAVQANPELYQGVACLGGGRGLRPVDGLKKIAFFIGCGSDDFALGGARGMEVSLKKAEVPSVLFREYQGVEHLTVVQLALRELLTYLEKNSPPKP